MNNKNNLNQQIARPSKILKLEQPLERKRTITHLGQCQPLVHIIHIHVHINQ